MKLGTLAIVIVSMVQTCLAATPFDLLAQGPHREIYPEPQERVLADVRYPFERVVWLHRAWAEAAVRAAAGSAIDEMLRDALQQHHMRECWMFTKDLERSVDQGRSRSLERWRSCLQQPPLADDLAAFVPVLERLSPPLTDDLAEFADEARAAAKRLTAPAVLATYAGLTSTDRDFFTKKRPWHKITDTVQHGFDGLMARLEGRFCHENLIRFFHRLQRWDVPDRVKTAAARALARQVAVLQEAVALDFDDRLAGGLMGRTQSIALVGDYVSTTTSLHDGRLRAFMKRLTVLNDGRDLRVLLPVLKQTIRHVARSVTDGDLPAAVRAYAKEVHGSLDTAATILALEARHDGADDTDADLFVEIRQALRSLDDEGHFTGL